MMHLIPLDHLEPHPANANVMPADLFAKLVAHLERTKRYPPLIVRPLTDSPMNADPCATAVPAVLRDNADDADDDRTAETAVARAPRTSPPRYQLLDGHHRFKALRKLGETEARCEVWDVDDDEAMLLLATLNRLQGRDDPAKRAAIVARLREHAGLRELAARLPENAERLQELMRMREPPPRPAPPRALGDVPVAVYFFLLPDERRRLEARLAAIGGPRERALMAMVRLSEVRDQKSEIRSQKPPAEAGG